VKLKDKVAIVTGGGRGIGEEIVRLFAKEGASVAIVDKEEEGMKKVANELKFKYGNVIEINADITNSSDIERIVKKIVEKFGKIDILVNNAGTIFPVDFLEISDDNWNFIQNVDLKGLVMCTKNVAPHMIKQKYGKIVNIQLDWLRSQYEYVKIHSKVVMPNHVHAVLEIDRSLVYGKGIKIKSLSELIGAFKTTSSKLIHKAEFLGFKWKRSFHDHIIKNSKSYQNIINYIQQNPSKWDKDVFNKKC
jgi:NADP-dependent 3-hydroxy acid dehydrogenase YdfG